MSPQSTDAGTRPAAANERRPITRGRPRAFTDDDLIHAAERLGPGALTLNEAAAILGVPRSTVYNRVANPDELGALVLSSRLETVLGAGWSPPEAVGWRDCLRSWALHLRAALLAGGPWIRYFSAQRHLDARSLGHAEIVLERLVADGFSVSEAGRAIGFVGSVYRDSAVVRAAIVVPRDIFDVARGTAESHGLELVIAGIDVNDPANEEAQFTYNLDRALDGIASSLTAPQRRVVGDSDNGGPR